MSNTYTLNYTAEQINHRLDLINENKNLLQYPYKLTTLQTGLENVGDGSFLTTGIATSQEDIFLNDFSLPAGAQDGTTYTASLEVTDITGLPTTVTNPGFSLMIKIDNETQQSDAFTLSGEAVAQAYLTVPSGCSTKNLVIKPMIREVTKEANWVPYMNTIDKYVDERFNSVNTKLRDVLAFMKLVDIVDAE